jgi:hypothetical protein
MSYLGDFPEDGVVDFKFSTNASTGAATSIGSPGGAVVVYVGNSAEGFTDGVTVSEDFDGVTGVHHVRIDLSAGAYYVAGSECQVVLIGAEIDGQTVNVALREFSIERAGGALATLAEVLARLPAALVGGRMDASVGAMAADVITNTALAASAVTEIQSGLATSAAQAAQATSVEVGLVYDRIGAPAGASIAADIATKASQASVDTVDGNVDLIKAKTDQLTFTGGAVDANLESVIGAQIQQNGSASTNWGAAP